MKRETSASPDTASPNQQTAGETQRTLSSREKAAQKRIGDLRRRLLDLSNSNRLLNYKFSNRGCRQIRIVDELPDQLLRKLLDGKRLVFKALPEPGDQPADEKSDKFLLALEQAKRSDEEYLAALKNLNQDDDEPVRRIERALRDRLRKTLGMPDRRLFDQTSRANWASHEGIDPSFDLPMPKAAPKPSHLNDDIQTLLFPEEMDRVLSGVHDQARVTLQEKGVNTLYLALGYLEWYEALDSQTPMYAPLLLHPVDIERKIQRGRYRYSIGSLGDETEVNITLSERLHQDFHRRLPPPDEDDTPERYFRKVTETIEGMSGWRVRRFAVLGHFAFARLVMFQDLQDSHWLGGVGIIGNPVIAELFAGPGTSAGMFFAEDYEVDHPAIAAKVPLLIADADSSQFSAIADVMDGKNLVIKGPPGTGKSQTITNIIAAALARGKTVLFVAEKMAALNVVKDRLEKAGLGDFCLELHSTKARKKDLLESLDRRLKIQNRLAADGDLTAATKELERTRGLLSDYVATINRSFGASGKTVHQILWSEQRTRIRRESLPKALDDIQLAGAKEMTRHDVTALKDKLKVLADAYAAATRTGSLDRHPWFGIGDATLDYFGRERLVADMKGLRDALRQVASVLAAIEGKVCGARPRTIGDAITLNEALARLPGPAPGIDFELYATLHDSAARAALEALQAEQAAWLETGRKLAEWTSDPNGLARRHSELRELAQLAAELGLDAPLGALIEQAAAPRAEADKVEQAIVFARRLAKGFGVADDPLTVATAQKLLAGAKQAAAIPSDLLPLRHPGLFNEQASAILRDADERAQTLARKIGQLAERLTVTLNGQAEEWRRHAQVLRSARFPFAFLRRDVRAAKTCWREMRRKPLKSKRHHMAADFEALAECVEIAASFTSDAGLQEVCGPHFRGHETEFNNLVQVNSYALAVKRTFGGDDATNECVRGMLLEGSIDALIQLVSLACDPQSARTEVTIANISNTEVDLVAHHRTLNTRAQQIAELGRRALAIGLKSDLLAGAIPDLARVVSARLQAEAKIEANSAARELLGTRWHGAESDRSLIVNVLDAASEVDGAMLPEPIRAYLYDADRDSRISDLRAIRARLNDAINAAREAWSRVKDGGKVDEGSFFGAALEKTSVADALRRVDRALEVPDQLMVWISYLVAREECVARGLAGIVDAFAGQALEAAQLSDALDRVFWRTLARAALAEFPALSRFRGLQLEKARERFRHLDEEIIALQRKALAAELCRRRPDPGYRGDRRKDDTGLVLVHHEISKQKRHIPIRELLDRAGRSIQQMTPCFMMSPLSVAQFLKPDGLRFDLVLIDEASQMRPEEALGAIARGGQLVVVGDPMQLPPTSFFDRVDRIEDEDLDEQEIEDRESILDLALAEFRPARNLRWHYRSRHESLIAFSNRHFYDDLIVFPSPLDPDRQKRQPRLGVYHHFVGGKYKGRINVEEAQKVAEAAIKFMADEPGRSLGIVTLNEPQSEVVREEIDRLVACDSAAQRYSERWEDTLEPFFVKNLENVQGDERDVIFISTVYGPDETAGVVVKRFGPINGVHGHRRLNVLFTRAKYRVEVFTSMKPGDIRPDQGSKQGIHVLKAYLEYAESGRLEGGIISGREPDSEFEELVRDRLRERGYEVVSQVGVAGYFIDLAVKHPKRSGFILGIECDGASYHSSRSARDRDRLRQLVLESRGWNIYRIWSTDWFQNSQEELRRLLSHLDGLAREEPSV